jgi:hypothetical protein
VLEAASVKRRPITNIVGPRELWARLRCWPGQWHNPSRCSGYGRAGESPHGGTAHMAETIAAKKRPLEVDGDVGC